MAIAIYQATSDGRHHWAEAMSPATLRNLASGEWVLFDATPATPPPHADPLDYAVSQLLAPGSTSATAVAGRAASRSAVAPHLQRLTQWAGGALRGSAPVASRIGLGRPTTTLSNGTDLYEYSRTAHTCQQEASSPRLWYGNLNLDGVGPDTIYVQAAIEKAGVVYPLFWRGQLEMPLAPGAADGFDPAGIDLTDGEPFFARQIVRVASVGQKWRRHLIAQSAAVEGQSLGTAAPAAGLISGAAPTTVNQTAVFSPLGITGHPAGDPLAARSLAIVGSSSAFGQGDSQSTRGAAAIAANTVGWPFVNVAKAGETAADYINTTLRARWTLIDSCTDAFIYYGTNDITGGISLAGLQANILTIAGSLKRRGMRIIVATLNPQTALTAPQALVRAGYNDWLRAGGIAEIDAVADWAAVTETAVNSNEWVTAYSGGDGTHMSAAGHAAVAVPTAAVLV